MIAFFLSLSPSPVWASLLTFNHPSIHPSIQPRDQPTIHPFTDSVIHYIHTYTLIYDKFICTNILNRISKRPSVIYYIKSGGKNYKTLVLEPLNSHTLSQIRLFLLMALPPWRGVMECKPKRKIIPHCYPHLV